MASSESKIKNQESKIVAACPFCKSAHTEMISLFGMQLMTTQHYCNNCHSAFEAVKWEAARENTERPENNLKS